VAGSTLVVDGDESATKANVNALAYGVLINGGIVNVLAHSTSEVSAVEWGWILDALQSFPSNQLSITSQQLAVTDILANDDSYADGVTTKAYSTYPDYRLRPGSPAINAGTSTSSGTVTLANSRLSLVDGTAFVDFSAAGTLAPYLGGRLTVTDSAGKKIVGYLKAAGAGETYATPAWADDCADDGTADWSVNDCSIAFDTDHYVTTYAAVTQHIYKSVTLGSGKLFLASVDVKNGTYTGAGVTNQIQTGLGSSVLAVKTGTTGADYATLSGYVTPTNQGQVDVYSFMTGAGTYLWKNYFIKQVLTPSVTGATIVSTRGGSVYNWESVEAGFNYNDASGYTYTISDFLPTTDFYGRNIRGLRDIGAYEFYGASGGMLMGLGVGF
jgi:hypothetical protein